MRSTQAKLHRGEHPSSQVPHPYSDNPQYHEDRIQEFKDGKCDYDFVIESGRKYHKVVMVSNQRSVHAFVDKKTGELYKAASWRGPAKDVRLTYLIPQVVSTFTSIATGQAVTSTRVDTPLIIIYNT